MLQNAVADGAEISTVNLLTFDYYFGTAAGHAGRHRDRRHRPVGQLRRSTRAPSAELWEMVGVTEMPGIDDFGPDETFTTADAPALLRWADRMGVGTLSFWALQRDNGGCPGTKGAGTCSGVTQPAVVLQPRLRAVHEIGASLPTRRPRRRTPTSSASSEAARVTRTNPSPVWPNASPGTTPTPSSSSSRAVKPQESSPLGRMSTMMKKAPSGDR